MQKPYYMKTSIASLFVLICLSLTSFTPMNLTENNAPDLAINTPKDSVLRHVVSFKFKKGTSAKKIKEIEEAFANLPNKIPQIVGYEWGLNNSPEGLNKGFTHCFFLTFNSEEDRALYLPHPDHKAFGALLGDYLEDVFVIDYWARK